MIKNAKLRIIPLGGVDGIGMNITVFEYGDDIIVVDCGVSFPENDMLGVDLVIPDTSYLQKNSDKVRALILTHGHEDHIGAVPYFLKQINTSIYATKLTLGILEGKLTEHGLTKTASQIEVKPGQKIDIGAFSVEFIHVNHSMPDSVALCISTPVGKVFYTGDFKIDFTPIGCKPIDLGRIAELGNKGIKLLMCDSTNAERPGYTPSEKTIAASFDRIFYNLEKRVVIATFSSNVHRIQQIINASIKYNRRVAITGRSMLNVVKAASKLGYIDIPDGLIIDVAEMKRYNPNQLTLITTGSQGEPMSALYRMAFGEHPTISLGSSDLVILSASAIPGNEKLITKIVNELTKRGVEVIDDSNEVHVSGHACREELKIMHSLVKAEYFIPIHGEYKHLAKHASLAKELGMDPSRIFMPEAGKVFELSKRGLRVNGSVEAGQIMVDGYGVGDVGSVVLRDRKHLAEDGIIIVVATIDTENKELVSTPEIVSRGFVYVKESEALMDELEKSAANILTKYLNKGVTDLNTLKNKLKDELSAVIRSKIKRDPMILPIFTKTIL
ncbi:MAG TPA: ribonuclease J [Bacillota bacterium]|nr:ribonuclease J [Bacillota bacterium]HOK68477.1 ribonuclease J [Bacillota bacterium]HPP85105.1 ribonuclease J [Bacillota bacterium]